jgi:ArsR family transcriptional regulator
MSLPKLAPTCCAPLFKAALEPDQATELAALFRALGEPARLRLISLIAAQPDRQICACDLVEPLGLSQPTVSHHLKVLYEAGLLHKERRGNWIYYQIASAPFEMLQQVLGTI